MFLNPCTPFPSQALHEVLVITQVQALAIAIDKRKSKEEALVDALAVDRRNEKLPLFVDMRVMRLRQRLLLQTSAQLDEARQDLSDKIKRFLASSPSGPGLLVAPEAPPSHTLQQVCGCGCFG